MALALDRHLPARDLRLRQSAPESGPRTPLAPEAKRDSSVIPATYEAMEKVTPTQTPSTVLNEAALVATDLGGPQPLDVLVRHALEENRTVRAAEFDVLALEHRIPQVTALDDPIVSNTIFPIPSAAPQYSLMGYMPYATLLAQRFPWCGTLRLRGQAAEDDVKIALFELAAAQLDVVAKVKRAYYDLHFNEICRGFLKKNRALADDFLKVARERYRGATATQLNEHPPDPASPVAPAGSGADDVPPFQSLRQRPVHSEAKDDLRWSTCHEQILPLPCCPVAWFDRAHGLGGRPPQAQYVGSYGPSLSSARMWTPVSRVPARILAEVPPTYLSAVPWAGSSRIAPVLEAVWECSQRNP